MNSSDDACLGCRKLTPWLSGSPHICGHCSHQRASKAVFSALIIVTILLLISLLTSCKGIDTSSNTPPLSGGETPITTPARGLRLYNVGIDVSNNGSLAYYTEARNVIADWIDKAVDENSTGWVVYISLIGANGFDSAATKLIISVPATPTDAPRADLSPTPTPSNDPYKDAQVRSSIEQQNTLQTEAYQKILKQNHAKLTAIKASVHEQTNKLRTLQQPSPSTSSDIAGYLARCSERSAGPNGRTYVFIVSTLRNTTPFPVHMPSLPTANVNFLWFATTHPDEDARTMQIYTSALTSMGAGDISFHDVSTTRVLPNPFRDN